MFSVMYKAPELSICLLYIGGMESSPPLMLTKEKLLK